MDSGNMWYILCLDVASKYNPQGNAWPSARCLIKSQWQGLLVIMFAYIALRVHDDGTIISLGLLYHYQTRSIEGHKATFGLFY